MGKGKPAIRLYMDTVSVFLITSQHLGVEKNLTNQSNPTQRYKYHSRYQEEIELVILLYELDTVLALFLPVGQFQRSRRRGVLFDSHGRSLLHN